MPCATWIAGGAAAAKTLGPKNCILWGYMWVPKCIWLNDSNMDVSWCCYAFGKPDILANCQLFVLLSNWISQSHRGTAAPEVPSFDDRDRSSHGVHRQIPPGPSSFFAMDRHRSLRRLQNGVWYFDALGTGYVSLEKWRKSRTLQHPMFKPQGHVFLNFGVRVSEHYSKKHQTCFWIRRWGDGFVVEKPGAFWSTSSASSNAIVGGMGNWRASSRSLGSSVYLTMMDLPAGSGHLNR